MNDQDAMNHQHSTPHDQLLSHEGHATSFQDPSSKDVMFFDSQAYLESDCEDFFSVHGDLTPSRGDSFIIDQSRFAEEEPADSNDVYLERSPDSTMQPSPTPSDTQKKLSEFLHENLLKVDQVNDVSGEIIASTSSKPESSGLIRSVSCCLPRFPRSLNFGERKKASASAQTKASSLL